MLKTHDLINESSSQDFSNLPSQVKSDSSPKQIDVVDSGQIEASQLFDTVYKQTFNVNYLTSKSPSKILRPMLNGRSKIRDSPTETSGASPTRKSASPVVNLGRPTGNRASPTTTTSAESNLIGKIQNLSSLRETLL